MPDEAEVAGLLALPAADTGPDGVLAAPAEMLRRLGQPAQAAAAYDAAIVRAANGAERAFLLQRRDSLPAGRTGRLS